MKTLIKYISSFFTWRRLSYFNFAISVVILLFVKNVIKLQFLSIIPNWSIIASFFISMSMFHVKKKYSTAIWSWINPNVVNFEVIQQNNYNRLLVEQKAQDNNPNLDFNRLIFVKLLPIIVLPLPILIWGVYGGNRVYELVFILNVIVVAHLYFYGLKLQHALIRVELKLEYDLKTPWINSYLYCVGDEAPKSSWFRRLWHGQGVLPKPLPTKEQLELAQLKSRINFNRGEYVRGTFWHGSNWLLTFLYWSLYRCR